MVGCGWEVSEELSVDGRWGADVGRDRDLASLIDETSHVGSREIAISMIGGEERWIQWGGSGVDLGRHWGRIGVHAECFGHVSVLVNSKVMGGDVQCMEVRLGGGKRHGVGGWWCGGGGVDIYAFP